MVLITTISLNAQYDPRKHNALGNLVHAIKTVEKQVNVPMLEKELESFVHKIAQQDLLHTCGLDARTAKAGYALTQEFRSVNVKDLAHKGILASLHYLGHIEDQAIEGAIKSHHLTPEVIELFKKYSEKLKTLTQN